MNEQILKDLNRQVQHKLQLWVKDSFILFEAIGEPDEGLITVVDSLYKALAATLYVVKANPEEAFEVLRWNMEHFKGKDHGNL